jgi:uncharacterized protein (DUF305 family)
MPRGAPKLVTFLLVVAVAVTLTGCGGDQGDVATGESTATNGDVFNKADVEFATSMIPHHAQAVEMVVLAQARPLDPEVARLRDQIRDAQVPEIETMTDWLTAWGEEIPETSLDHTNAGHDMSGADGMQGTAQMPGMMTQEEMDALEAASDAEFQGLWLEMMTEHHRGAIEMAQTERRDGRFTDALALAKDIETGQTQEVATMEALQEG